MRRFCLNQLARCLLVLLCAAGAGAAVAAAAAPAKNKTLIRIFVGAQQRPAVMREVFARYMQMHPEVQIELETGGATSELQSRYLNMMLSASDTHLDAFLIDVVRPAQYAAAGWLEPLDAYLGAEREQVLGAYLPNLRQADMVDGKLVALPAFADAQFLYYRKDLLAKYGIAEPDNWDALARAARQVTQGERNARLQGLSVQGKAVEGAVCTFLMPYWSAGAQLDVNGKFVLDQPKARAALELWLSLLGQGVLKKNIAEVATDDTRKEFQAGNAVFAVNFGYAWNHFQSDPDSAVKGRVGVLPVPKVQGGSSASCLGGWHWAVSRFSRQKAQTVQLVRWLASDEVAKMLALKASNLPSFAHLYADPEVLAANPFFGMALPAVEGARARPVTPEYRAVSDALRINTNAVLAGVKTPAAAVADITARFDRVNR